MNKELIYKNIRVKGGRITKFRQTLIEILLTEDCLISLAGLLVALKKRKLEPNRSTIYRELKFLAENNIIIKNIISGANYYEISPAYRNFNNSPCSSNQKSSNKDHHHHHLICLKCNKIIKVEMLNQLKKEEARLAEKNKFSIVNHSLDFYGYCPKCQA